MTLEQLAALPEQPPVVGNASRDGTVEAVRADHPDVTVVALPENRGATARMIGAEQVDTPIFRHAANSTGRTIRPIPPVIDAPRVARAIVRCVKRPKAEITVGQVGRVWVGADAILPRLYDRAVPLVMDRLGFHNVAAEPGPGNPFEPKPRVESGIGEWRWEQADVMSSAKNTARVVESWPRR